MEAHVGIWIWVGLNGPDHTRPAAVCTKFHVDSAGLECVDGLVVSIELVLCGFE